MGRAEGNRIEGTQGGEDNMMVSYWPQPPAPCCKSHLFLSRGTRELPSFSSYRQMVKLGLTMTLICMSKQGSPRDKVGSSKDKKSPEAPEAC